MRTWTLALAVAGTPAVLAGARGAHAGDRLLVLQKYAESLTAYDPATGRALGPAVALPPIPHEMAATADGRELYVTNYGVKTFRDAEEGANTVAVVDARRMEKVGAVDLGIHRRPHGIARGARSGRFYVTVDAPAALLVIDPARRTVAARYPIDQQLPHMVAVTPDEGRAVVANSGSGTLTILSLGAAGRTAAARPRHLPIGGTPMGMALTADGRWLYATNRDGNQVVVVDMAAEKVARQIAVRGEPARVTLAIDERFLLVGAIAGGAVAVIDTATFEEVARIAVGERPEGVLVDEKAGIGYVSAQNDDKVVAFSVPGWKVLREIKTASHPDALFLVRAPERAAQGKVDGAATNFFEPARMGALPAAQRDAWARYLADSARLQAADRAAIAAELRAAGKTQMTAAPYRKSFRMEPSMTPAWLRSEDGRRMAEALLSFQTPSGGWSKHVDLTGRPRQSGESYYSENEGWHYIATIDNDSTTEQIRFVWAAFAATGDPRLKAAFDRGLDYLLRAQLPSGGWPQVFPLQGGYHDAITYNDDAMVNVLRVLGDFNGGRLGTAAASAPPAEAQRRAAAAAAIARGVRCLLATQAVEADGTRAIWAQQHDPVTLAPVAARSYELPGLAGRESARIVAYLMSLPAPDAGVVTAVHAAAAWLRAHAILGHDYDGKNGLRPAARGGPLWARLYELGTGRPIFSNRDGVKLYDWDQLTDRRFGYAWFGKEPAPILTAYDAWSRANPRAP